jgi:hypothetical protein
MNNFEKKLHNLKNSPHLRLDSDRSHLIRSNLEKIINIEESLSRSSGFSWRRILIPVSSGVVAIVLGTAALGAEASVPGDILYAVKTNVNESIMGVIARGQEGEIAYQAKIVARRAAENEVIAVRYEKDKEKKEAAVKMLNKSLENFEEHARLAAESQEQSMAASYAAQVEAVMESHQNIMAAVTPKDAKKVRAKSVFREENPTGSSSGTFGLMRAGSVAAPTASVPAGDISVGEVNDVPVPEEEDLSETETVLLKIKNQRTEWETNISSDNTPSVEEGAKKRVEYLRKKIDKSSDKESDALKKAKESLDVAQDLYSTGSYGEAFNIANNAAKAIELLERNERVSKNLKVEIEDQEGEEEKEEEGD